MHAIRRLFSALRPPNGIPSPGSWVVSMKMNESGDPGPLHPIKRSATLPAKLISQSALASATTLPDNVLFHHPSCRIVQFAPRSLAPIPSATSPSDFDYPVDTVETLPWRSASERTLATASLRIEKVFGGTVFLKCGSIVQPILKNSQCWCVDGVSKFVLRIRPLFYYRIEIPYETAEDKGLVEQLKTSLPTVLRYEVTPCPFKRAFTVELPEEATAPRRKKAWRPKDRRDTLAVSSGNLQVPYTDTRLDTSDSAGDDTDGATTDDSAITPKRANSVSSEASHTSLRTFEAPVPLTAPRRSVTETPQTFNSLRAKFEATSVPEESTPELGPASDSIPSEERVVKASTDDVAEVQSKPTDSTEAISIVSLPPGQKDLPEASDTYSPIKTEHAVIPTEVPNNTVTEAINASTPTEVRIKQSVDAENQIAPTETHIGRVSKASRTITPSDVQINRFTEAAHNTTPTEVQVTKSAETLKESIPTPTGHKDQLAFPDSFSSSESSPTHTTPERAIAAFAYSSNPIKGDTNSNPKYDSAKSPDLASQESEAHQVSNSEQGNSYAEKSDSIISAAESSCNIVVPGSVRDDELDNDTSSSSSPESFHSADFLSPSESISTLSSPIQKDDNLRSPRSICENDSDLPSATYQSLEGYSITANAGSKDQSNHGLSTNHLSPSSSEPPPRFTPNNPVKSSLAVPPIATASETSMVKKTTTATDFDHMSTEFRRRAQATRERDVSPMPPPSAIYQPKPGAEATSFLTKALTLVLVPPISLFIVLLHITARIVISQAIKPTSGDSSDTPQSLSRSPPIDDFSFPLEREDSTYEDAETTKALDPWDLD